MPFIPHTPESLIPRSDSKNPAATCRGLTASGRPCRRAISVPPTPSQGRKTSDSSLNELLTLDAFCWQHKDQATAAQAHSPPQGVQNSTTRERTSVDTLIDRLGLLEIIPEKGKDKRRKKTVPPRTVAYAGGTHYTEKQEYRPSTSTPRAPRKKSPLVLFCCIGIPDDDHIAARPRIPQHKPHPSVSRPPNPPSTNPRPQRKSPRPSLGTRQDPIVIPPSPAPSLSPSRTPHLLSLIPKTASPRTTSLLLAELSKPPSQSDDAGYIYIFWLTPTSLPRAPPPEAASSLLSPLPRPQAGRRTSEILQSFSITPGKTPKTVLVKIGRASNVQRRLNEWSRQCGYNVSLIRYYPYQPSSPSKSEREPRTPPKLLHAHKVERLVHIELAAMRAAREMCGVCGREHREWFEVEASREGVRRVDEVVRRWVEWGLRGHEGGVDG